MHGPVKRSVASTASNSSIVGSRYNLTIKIGFEKRREKEEDVSSEDDRE